MKNYYSEKLSAERLKQCYDIAPPRVNQYLETEIEYVLCKIKPADIVLELGCGYGRVTEKLVQKAGRVFGIDNSIENLYYAKELFGKYSKCNYLFMNAESTGFKNSSFDAVICIQNGISAFKIDPLVLITESMRITRPGGFVLFSTYSEKFWDARLNWFEIQAEYGLLGEIDYNNTGNGIITCKDGFKAVTFSPSELSEIANRAGFEAIIEEVDKSSIFCTIKK